MKTGNNNEALMAALKANTDVTRDIVAGATAMMDEVSASIRRRAEKVAKRRSRRQGHAMPPPVASLLHGFSRALAAKVDAISASLPDVIRERLRVVAPGFISAVLSNDPDVVQLFAMLLAATPDEAAHWLTEEVELLEQRFAS